MSKYLSSRLCLLPARKLHRRASNGSKDQSGPDTPIHMLNDDALLNIFYLYPQEITESYNDVLFMPNWDNARWWYKLAQVCRRWRHLILASPVRLGLHLLCTYGTPVADMLAHSPPLPIIVNYLDSIREVSAEDEGAILLAFQHRDRVRRIGLGMAAPNLSKYIAAMSEEFPVLERLYIWPQTNNLNLMLPTTFQAPQLDMISLSYATFPVGLSLLTVTLGLVSLELCNMPPSAYFHPSHLVEKLSSMPQLESLSIGFKSPIVTRDVERPPLHSLIRTLPNLRLFFFRGVTAYLEGLLARISTPVLEVLNLDLFNQLTFIVPHLLQFMTNMESLRFSFARLLFYQAAVILTAERREGDKVNPFDVVIGCRPIDWQVTAAAQIFSALVPALSIVEGLALGYEEHDLSSEQHNEVDRAQWRELLRPFSNVRVLHVAGRLVRKLSLSLQSENGGPPLEVFPELKELIYYKEKDDHGDEFTSFIDARQMAGRSVSLIRNSPPSSSWH